jgi:hypothetical protein
MKRWIICVVPILLYVGSYLPLSLAGQYERHPRNYIGRYYWRPVGLSMQASTGARPALNGLGYVYWPLVQADWALAHRPHFRC